MAIAFQNNRDLKKSLSFLDKAESLNNLNPMIKYRKATLYMESNRNDEALQILLELNEHVPKEAPIHVLIGKIYQKKKDYAKALSHFNSAIDIDPKDSNLAKSMIEKLYTDENNAQFAY